MNLKEFFAALKARKRIIIALAVIGLVLGSVITLIQPLKYRSGLKLLVVQQAGAGDAYNAMRSSEYLGRLLSQVTYSTSFADKVMQAVPSINRSYFGSSAKALSRRWGNSLEVNSIPETGVIEIYAYHSDRNQAEMIARGVGSVLIANHAEYDGSSAGVTIRILDEPITTSYPVRPNLPVNGILGLVAGALIGLLYIYLKNSSLELSNETLTEETLTLEPAYDNNYSPDFNRPEVPEAPESLPWVSEEEMTPDEEYLHPGSIDHLLRR